MSKTYRSWDPDQAYLLPPSPSDWLPEDDLVYFVLDTGSVKGTSLIVQYGFEMDRWKGTPPSGRRPSPANTDIISDVPFSAPTLGVSVHSNWRIP